MTLTNTSKPTSSLSNTSKVSFGETWGTITPSYASETRSWALTASLFRNVLKPETLINSFSSPPTTGTRNDFTGSLGFRFTVSSTIYLFKLGRLYVTGNSQNHLINIWISTDTVTPIASATVLASTTSDSNNYKYASLASSVTLSPGNTYYAACDETASGDAWKNDWLPTGTMQSVFTVGYSVWSSSNNTFPSNLGTVNQMYDTISFKYNTVNSESSLTNLPKP